MNSPPSPITLSERLNQVREQIQQAEIKYGRTPGSVNLVAVSKRHPLSAISEAVEAGQLDFGENFVQESLEKITSLGNRSLKWHFIGHLQSNKSNEVAHHFDWVHTIDREKIARRLSGQRPEAMKPMNICIQVNLDQEPNKSGVTPEEVPDLAERIAGLPRLRLRGLMALPAANTLFQQQRLTFARLRELNQNLADRGIITDTLSMGMTSDLEAAIAEGATHVRVGTAIFGPRPPKTD